MSTYDVAIIGAGPGGYVAAIRASQLNLKTVVIEKDKPGGVCLNWGCIPSKSLIHQAEMFCDLTHVAQWGIDVNTKSFDYGKVHATSRKAVTTLTRGVEGLLKKNKVEYITGTAKIKSPKEIVIDENNTVHATHIIVATGSRPKTIPGFEFDETTILSSTGILSLKKLPESLIILGAGAIGMEFAYVMNSFGVQVTVIEMLPQVLPLEDADVAKVVAKSFTDSGITLYTDTKAQKLKKMQSHVELTVEDSKGAQSVIKGEKLLVAVGRSPNTEGLGLDAVGVETEKGFVKVVDYNQTRIPGIYAIGDVVWGTPLLAHVASKEGEIAVEHIAGTAHERRLDEHTIPSAVYCNPQVGSFGFTEVKAKELGKKYTVSSFSYMGAGKAIAIEKAVGLVKIITDASTKEILGAHIVGYNATEIIHELLLAKSAELLPTDIATMIHAHPTISEAVMEGARAVEGWAIHN